MYETFWAIRYHLYNFKNLKDTDGIVLLLVKLQTIKSNTSPLMFFMFFELCKCHQSRKASHISNYSISFENCVVMIVY